MMSQGTYVSSLVKERISRLKTDSPVLRYNEKVTVESAIPLIKPLSVTKVSQNDFDFCMRVLEQVTPKSESKASDVARFISTEIMLGVEPTVDIDMAKYNINDRDREIISSGINEAAIAERIIKNHDMLCKRFNVDKIVKENMYNSDKIVSELCELIDTYNVPDHYKYNVALENIIYSMVKNGVDVDDTKVVSSITEYFMYRDMNISDEKYKNYQEVLANNYISRSLGKDPLIEAVLHNPSTTYRDLTESLLGSSSDLFITEYFLDKALEIHTEADAADYMEEVEAYTRRDIPQQDKVALYKSIDNIPRYSGVSKDFINIKKSNIFDKEKFDSLCTLDGIVSDTEAINEKNKYNIFDKESFKTITFEADTSDIEGLIAKYKADQDKSPSKIKNFFIKLHTKSPEVIIDDLPDVMAFARAGILLAVATITPIGPIVAGVLGLVSWLISKKINDKEANRLLSSIRSEKKKVQDKIDKSSNEKKAKQLEEYLDCLKKCEDKVESYLDSIEDADHSDPDEEDDDLDFDIDFENSFMNIAQAAILSESIINTDMNNINWTSLITKGAKINILYEISNLVLKSSVPVSEYMTELRKAKEAVLSEPYIGYDKNIVNTAIDMEKYRLDYIKEDAYSIRNIFEEDIANQALLEMSYQVIQEKFNLNTVKLALQNAKAKLKELNTKQKSLWQSVDAQGSGLIKSIEKALTSDRREAIIKGSIIPSFSKCIKGAIALAGTGIIFGPTGALIAAIGGLATSKVLNDRERKLLFDEIDTELKVVEKQIEIAQNDGDMNQYRFLLNYQKKLTREYQRIKYGFKVQGRDIPKASIPGKGGH